MIKLRSSVICFNKICSSMGHKYHLLGYFQVLLICLWSVQLCQIAKSTLLFFCLANLISLIWRVHIAKLLSSSCHVCIPKSPSPHCQGNVAKLPSPFHPADCLKCKLPTNINISGVYNAYICFSVCWNFCPKNLHCPFLFLTGGFWMKG
jgi:hypothetical protein